MKASILLSDEERRSLVQKTRDASRPANPERASGNAPVSKAGDIYQFSDWTEIERVAQQCLGDAAAAWLEKPLRRFGGKSVRQAVDSSQREAVFEFMQQIMSGYIF